MNKKIKLQYSALRKKREDISHKLALLAKKAFPMGSTAYCEKWGGCFYVTILEVDDFYERTRVQTEKGKKFWIDNHWLFDSN